MPEPIPPELEEIRQGLTGGDRAIFDANVQYILRLRRILINRVERNELSREAAQRIAVSYENYLTGTGVGPFRKFTPIPTDAPFYRQIVDVDDLVFEEARQKEITALGKQRETQLQQTAKREASQRTYLPQLNNYLDFFLKKGSLTEEQRRDALTNAQQQLSQGVPATDLPNFQSVKEFETPPDFKKTFLFRSMSDTQRKNLELKSPERQQEILRGLALQEQTEGVIRSIQEQSDVVRQRREVARTFVADQQRRAAEGGVFASRPSGFKIAMEKRAAFEREREFELLRTPDTAFNWIKRWKIQHQFNPFTEEGTGFESPEEERSNRMDIRAEREEARRTALPSTPAFLKTLVPGLGERISRDVAIPTPSAQQLSRLDPSQIQKFGGFAEFAGQNPEDIFSRVNRMLPESPATASRFRFAPPRQRS